MSRVLIKLSFLALGIIVLVLAVNATNLDEVFDYVYRIGWYGLVVVLFIYFVAFALDSITWTLTITSFVPNLKWIFRTLLIRLVGEALNNTIPLGGFGGEPVKAVLMKSYYGVKYSEGTASLILAKTLNMISLSIFVMFGFIFVFLSHKLSFEVKQVAFIGLLIALIFTGLLFGIQRFKFSSPIGKILGRLVPKHATKLIRYLSEFEGRLFNFYGQYRIRMGWGIFLGLGNWFLGALEVYFIMALLGVSVTFTEAYIIEVVAQMVRLGTFFIPMSLGAQEGAFLIIVLAVTGSSSAGLALGIIRRAREFIWIVFGFLVGIKFSSKKT